MTGTRSLLRPFYPGLLLLLCASCLAQRGALTVPRNLAQLTAQSAVIVHGRVAAVRVEPDPQLTHLHTVVVTLNVSETLKGKAGKTFTFRQFIWDMRDIKDAAGYRKGQELLLLMNPPTSYGLSSPAGLGQGRFRILQDASGERVAVNERGNQGLFRGLSATLKSQGVNVGPHLDQVIARGGAAPVRLQDLRELIQKMAKEN